LADGTVQTKTLQIVTKGGSNGLLVDGASATSTGVGGLLGGDIALYVDNSNGDLTADELARIQDAVTAVDAMTEPYGVAVQEVADPTLADVTLNMDTTTAVGGYADGVLGCTTDAGQITLIQGWNFYAGNDATQIGSAQYDFETVVTHELGHASGLGHSTESTSVMYASLDIGAIRRSLASTDFNVPGNSDGADGLHAAQSRDPVSALETGFLSGGEKPGFQGSNRVEDDPARHAFFALLGSGPDGPPLGSRQLLGWSGEPGQTDRVAGLVWRAGPDRSCRRTRAAILDHPGGMACESERRIAWGQEH
jgi:hypothetical protein